MTLLVSSLLSLGALFFADEAKSPSAPPIPNPSVKEGMIHFRPLRQQTDIPERYRLEERDIAYKLAFKREMTVAGLTLYELQFPSPVTSSCKENNTVYAEYYRPSGDGPFPGVIVLDITGGDQSLSRMIANCLAQNKIAALFVQMAYYGPRRPAGSKRRLLSPDFARTMEGIRQTVLDVRWAAAWLAEQPEIYPERIGIHGTSLGSMIGALAAEMEPRLGRVSILLGGGGLVDAYYDDPRAASYRKLWEAIGGTRAQAIKILSPVDPLTYADKLKDRSVLMVAGKKDEIIPPKTTTALWEAAGKPKIIWYNCGHYTAILYLGPIMTQVVAHFKKES